MGQFQEMFQMCCKVGQDIQTGRMQSSRFMEFVEATLELVALGDVELLHPFEHYETNHSYSAHFAEEFLIIVKNMIILPMCSLGH